MLFKFSKKSHGFRGASLAAHANVGAAVLVALGIAGPAVVNASVIQLTTGDPTATAPAGSTSVTLSNVVDAIYTPVSGSALNTSAGTLTWQGVAFSAASANVTRAAGNPQWFTPPSRGHVKQRRLHERFSECGGHKPFDSDERRTGL